MLNAIDIQATYPLAMQLLPLVSTTNLKLLCAIQTPTTKDYIPQI